MASPNDLTDLETVKSFLVPVNGTVASDAVLSGLISGASRLILSYLSRTLTAASYTELRNGNRRSSIRVLHWPIISVSAVKIDGQPIPSAQGQSPVAAGFVYDDKYVYLRKGVPEGGGGGYLLGGSFGGWEAPFLSSQPNAGIKNVEIDYTAGYITPGQLAIQSLPPWQPTTNYAVGSQILQPTGYYYTARNSGTSSSSEPAFPQAVGALVQDGSVVWVCSGQFIPPPPEAPLLPELFQQAANELISYHFIQRTRIGDKAMGEGPQRIQFDTSDIPPYIRALLDPERDVVVVSDWS